MAEPLEEIALVLERLARELRHVIRGRQSAADDRADALARASAIRGTPANVAALVAAGTPVDQAIDQVAASLEIPAETVKAHMARQKRLDDDAARAERDRSIVQAAAKGWTNAQIADRYSVSTTTVSRIVRAAYRVPRHEKGR